MKRRRCRSYWNFKSENHTFMMLKYSRGNVEILKEGVCKLWRLSHSKAKGASCHMAHSLRLYLVPLHGDLLHGGWRLLFIPDWRLLFSCLALDSSSSFPCPAFLAIAKSEPFIDID
ncbi:hypothetical protein STEG23_015726 [Scotinomys teguina]